MEAKAGNMDDILVDTYKLNYYAQRLGKVNSRLARLDRRLNSLYLRVDLLGLWDLIQADAMTCYSRRIVRCQSYLRQTAADFETAEKRLLAEDPANFHPPTFLLVLLDLFNTSGGSANPFNSDVIVYGMAASVLEPSSTYDKIKGFLNVELKNSESFYRWRDKSSDDEGAFFEFLDREASISDASELGKYKDDKILGEKFDFQKKQTEKKDPSKQINDDEDWYEPDLTLFEEKIECKLDGSVIDTGTSGSGKYAEGSIEAKILTAEIYGEVAAGLYSYKKDKDGNITRMFSPGVSAEVGASCSVIDVDGDFRIGLGENKNMLGIYGEVEAEVLSAEGEAKFAVNKDEIYVGASAEANIAKVSGSLGGSVLGTDIGVNGSIKVGVGAHAKVGYTDGKFKVDIGAAVGVGFDVGFEVDIGGTVEAVSECAEQVWNDTKVVWDNAKDAVSVVWDGAKNIWNWAVN